MVTIAGKDQKLFATGRSEPLWLAQSTTAPATGYRSPAVG